jgi:AhpD family alkylhydroperoxidase
MAGMVIRTALWKSLSRVRYVSVTRPAHAQDLVAEVYRQVERDLGMLAPPVALHSVAPEVMAACWMMVREALVAKGLVDRTTKEAVATTVSLGNSCQYCVDLHVNTLDALGEEREANGIGDPAAGVEYDHAVRRVAEWARARGKRAAAIQAPQPFPDEYGPELIGTVTAFHYVNRMVNVFLPESPLPASVSSTVRSRTLRALGKFMLPAALRCPEPGEALDLLPEAALPGDLAWAADNHPIANAFARAAAAVDAAGERSVPVAVQEIVHRHLSTWDGTHGGPSRAWLIDAVSGLAAEDRPAGRLALLTATASEQLDQSIIDDFRRVEPEDRALVELTAWASFTAARAIGNWA